MSEQYKVLKFDHDLGLRHKAGMTASEFITRYCEVFRPFAYATEDDSLNEFEKLITHVLNMLCYHKERAKILGLPADPRESIREIEDAQQAIYKAKLQLANAVHTARGKLSEKEIIDAAMEGKE